MGWVAGRQGQPAGIKTGRPRRAGSSVVGRGSEAASEGTVLAASFPVSAETAYLPYKRFTCHQTNLSLTWTLISPCMNVVCVNILGESRYYYVTCFYALADSGL